MRVNSFTEIDDRNFNEVSLSTIKIFLKKIIEFISRNKNDANSNAHESLFYKQKTKSDSMWKFKIDNVRNLLRSREIEKFVINNVDDL